MGVTSKEVQDSFWKPNTFVLDGSRILNGENVHLADVVTVKAGFLFTAREVEVQDSTGAGLLRCKEPFSFVNAKWSVADGSGRSIGAVESKPLNAEKISAFGISGPFSFMLGVQPEVRDEAGRVLAKVEFAGPISRRIKFAREDVPRVQKQLILAAVIRRQYQG